jgi:hypothetical protein
LNVFLFACKLKEGDELVSTRRFYGKNLSTIELPSTIKRIEESAFEDNELTEIVLPAALTYIGPRAFSNNQITKLEIPEGVTEIGDYAFSNNKISEITLPVSIEKIGNNVFSNNAIQKLEIPESVVTIGNNAFSNNQIESLIIPPGVKDIGDSAFENNKLTINPVFSNQVKLGARAFANNQIKEINLRQGLSFQWNTFDHNDISKFILTEGYKNIGGAPNNKITSIVIPVSAETIIDHAFENNQISRLTIPASVKTIGGYAFKGNKITGLRIPRNVERIGDYAFADNPLEWVTIENRNINIGTGNFSARIMNSIVRQTAVTLSYDELAREMNKWQGKTIKISGRISQINDPETSRPKIYLDCSGDWEWSLEWDYKKIYVTYTYSDNEAHFLENDRVIVYGTATGMSDHHSQLDLFGLAGSKLPQIRAEIIERQKR